MSRPVLLQPQLGCALLLVLVACTSMCAGHIPHYYVSRSKSIKGNDMQCNQLDSQGKPASYCRQCGGIAALATKCSSMSGCAGFDMETYACGYFKTRADKSVLQDQSGFTSFCMEGKGRDCGGDYVMCTGNDADGGDFNCGWKDLEKGVVQSFCRRDGDHIALMDECDRNSKCTGFSIDVTSNGQYGILKSVPGRVWNNLVRKQGYSFFARRAA